MPETPKNRSKVSLIPLIHQLAYPTLQGDGGKTAIPSTFRTVSSFAVARNRALIRSGWFIAYQPGSNTTRRQEKNGPTRKMTFRKEVKYLSFLSGILMRK